MYKRFAPLLFPLLAACATPQTPQPLTLADMMKTQQEAADKQKQALRSQRSREKSPTGTITTVTGETYAVAQFGTPQEVTEYYIKPFREDYRYIREVSEIRDNGNHYLITLKTGGIIESMDKSKAPLRYYDAQTDNLEKTDHLEIVHRRTGSGEAVAARIPLESIRVIHIDN